MVNFKCYEVEGDKGEKLCSCTAPHIFLQLLLSVGIQGILHALGVKVVTNCKMTLNNTGAFHVAWPLTSADVGSGKFEIPVVLGAQGCNKFWSMFNMLMYAHVNRVH